MSPVAMGEGGGWITVAWRESSRRLSLRIEERQDGRLQIVELRLAHAAGLSGAELRDLQLGAWEAQMNAPEIAAALRAQLRERGPDDFYELDLGNERLAGELEGDPPGLDDGGLEFRFPAGVSFAVSVAVEPRLNLAALSGGKRPDAFYRDVAEAYSWLAGRERRPAKSLAAINEVPASTVHRWVKEARRRGLLGPGRRLAASEAEESLKTADQRVQIIYDPTSPEVLEWARRARDGQVSDTDIANDHTLRAWATRVRKGMSSIEQSLDPIVRACYARLSDESVGSEKYFEPITRLVLARSPSERSADEAEADPGQGGDAT